VEASTPRRTGRLLILAPLLLLILAAIPVLTVSALEESDRFCASCHVVPERTYYNRAQFALAGVEPVTDLSSAHYLADPADLPHRRPFRCIDCHRGDEGAIHRATALTLGARDTAIYLFGAPDPSIEKTHIEVPVLLTESCIKCHAGSLLVVGFPNHYHNKLPLAYQVWQRGGTLTTPQENAELFQPALEAGLQPVEESTLLCVDCHPAHVSTPGSEQMGFIDVQNVVFPACEECHIAALGVPLGLAEVGSGIEGLDP